MEIVEITGVFGSKWSAVERKNSRSERKEKKKRENRENRECKGLGGKC
jgi:hypothetical protein